VTGESYSNETYYDYATIKYNSTGVQQWAARFNGYSGNNDFGKSLALDGSGNVYVTGKSVGTGTMFDYATVKYNSLGVQQWVSRYNGPGNYDDIAVSIVLDGAGNVYVTGYSRSGISTGTNDYVTIKYNSSGVQQWVSKYNSAANDEDCAYSIAVDGSGNVYVTGESWGSGTYCDYATIKYNSSGIQQWVQRYNGPGNFWDEAFSIALDKSANVYVTGYSGGNGTSDDYATIKYNSSGVQQWVQRYNGPGNSWDDSRSIAVDSVGNAYVTGYSRSGQTAGTEDYATIKYNSSGIQQWVKRYNGSGNSYDYPQSIAVDASGNVCVTGAITVSGAYYDYATIKYTQQIGIQIISTEIPKSYALYQNYPNPFNPSTKIKFEIPFSPFEGGKGDVKLVVYDVLGKEITILINQLLQPGTYEVEWNGSNYPSGVYFYKLFTSDFTETRKMVLIK
jgi:hypothetical protein